MREGLWLVAWCRGLGIAPWLGWRAPSKGAWYVGDMFGAWWRDKVWAWQHGGMEGAWWHNVGMLGA
jgi:hypothetical protein